MVEKCQFALGDTVHQQNIVLMAANNQKFNVKQFEKTFLVFEAI